MSSLLPTLRGSAPSSEVPTGNGVLRKPTYAVSASANEAAVRVVNSVLSGAAAHARHPDPRSGLLESHIHPVIYTKYHFEDLKLGFLQYNKEMTRKHDSMGVTLSEGDIATYSVIQVRREYPAGHPRRRILLEQMDRPNIQIFWVHKSAKDKKAL